MKRFQDFIIDENLTKKDKSKRSTIFGESNTSSRMLSRFGALAEKSTLTRGKANTFKVPGKRRDADVKLKF